jgi:hypothetical protein
MKEKTPIIDYFLFEKHLNAFKSFVEQESGIPFSSLNAHPFVEKHEGYKYQTYRDGRENLAFQTWTRTDVGTGKIISRTIQAIEIQGNNLVQWQSRYGDESRPHHPLHEALSARNDLKRIEEILFDLYHELDTEKSFEELIGIFGKKYSLIAYLLFLKDSSKYLPLAPSYFDDAFELLGVDFKTSQKCSWDNYSLYLLVMTELKRLLSDALSSEVSLIDSHSFAWMLSSHMKRERKLPDVREYLELSSTEREAIVKARVGQGQFRQSLINYWSSCAVSGCQDKRLLKASHIKPWRKSSVEERLSLYNGLLLNPSLDECFDSGFISFDDFGRIMVSEELTKADMDALAITKDMKLAKLENGHKKYLAYHRAEIFKKN